MEKLNIKDKNIIVFGLGVTGISSVKVLNKLNANVYIYDDRDYDDYKQQLEKLKDYNYKIIDKNNINFSDFHLLLKSPGIKNSNEFLMKARENNLEIVSDIELAYRLWGGENIIAVTGTNGKTTVTSLITHILNYAGIKTKYAGNIGVGILWEMYNNQDFQFVVEVSSFQLDATRKFKPKIAIITNITEDHIDWHGSFENYKNAKYKIFKNLDKNDLLILNRDDRELKHIKSNSRIEYFSLKSETDAFYENKKLNYIHNGEVFSIDRESLNLVGDHNVANALVSILAVKEFNIKKDVIEKAIKEFKSIEHRIEYVETIDNVKYYNDSKGTNIDSTKVAISGFENDIILIAGGYDKGSEFDDLFKDVKNIKLLIVYGDTKDKIAKSAEKNNIETIKVKNLEEAVNLAHSKQNEVNAVLFSPACASWDMYKNFEERGNHFKKIVRKLQ